MAIAPKRMLSPEPEVILPAQFFATLRRAAPRKGGEYRLLVAILEDAVACFQKYAFVAQKRNHRIYDEAARWIMEDAHGRDHKATDGFSFEQTCAFLGLDPAYLRRGLQRWRDAQIVRGDEAGR